MSALTAERVVHQLSDVQDDFVHDQHRYALFLGGIGAGKSHAGAVKALVQEIPRGPRLGLVIAPTYPIDANMTKAGEQFFQPPTVAGWTGYHDWLTTNTFPVRGTEATAAVSQSVFDDTTAIAFIKQFPNYSDATALAGGIGALLLPRPLSKGRTASFASKLAGGGPLYEWSSILSGSPSTAARNLRDLLSYIITLPDFELC